MYLYSRDVDWRRSGAHRKLQFFSVPLNEVNDFFLRSKQNVNKFNIFFHFIKCIFNIARKNITSPDLSRFRRLYHQIRMRNSMGAAVSFGAAFAAAFAAKTFRNFSSD